MPDPFRALSWGCGIPSTTLAVMSALGDLPKLDAVIHADTQFESTETVRMRDWYAAWLEARGISVHIVTRGSIRDLGAHAHIHIPFFTSDGGPLKRQCTREYKVRPTRRLLRQLMGYHPSKAPNPPAGAAEKWLGYTIEEYTRIRDSEVQFVTKRYPLIERTMTRQDCTDYLTSHSLPLPPKSACLCCPYRLPSAWLELRQTAPADWQAAVQFDEANRHNPLAARDGSTADELYIYKYCQPLATANLKADAAREKDKTAHQIPLMCGGAPCFT